MNSKKIPAAQVEQVLEAILADREAAMAIYDEVSNAVPPEGKTMFDVLCERLSNEIKKK